RTQPRRRRIHHQHGHRDHRRNAREGPRGRPRREGVRSERPLPRNLRDHTAFGFHGDLPERVERARAALRRMEMSNTTTALGVRRIGDAGLMDIRGDVTAQSEPALAEAFADASTGGIRAVVLNFTALDYMNSGGIGLPGTRLVRANHREQRLGPYGVTE